MIGNAILLVFLGASWLLMTGMMLAEDVWSGVCAGVILGAVWAMVGDLTWGIFGG